MDVQVLVLFGEHDVRNFRCHTGVVPSYPRSVVFRQRWLTLGNSRPALGNPSGRHNLDGGGFQYSPDDDDFGDRLRRSSRRFHFPFGLESTYVTGRLVSRPDDSRRASWQHGDILGITNSPIPLCFGARLPEVEGFLPLLELDARSRARWVSIGSGRLRRCVWPF